MLGVGECGVIIQPYEKLEFITSKLKELKSNYENVVDDYSYETHMCHECDFFGTMPSIKFITDDFIYTYRQNCPSCNNKLNEVKIEDVIDDLKCPQCNSYSLKIEDGMLLWD